jgi:hypothetical protein
MVWIMSRQPKPNGRRRNNPYKDLYTMTDVRCPATGKVSYASEFIAKSALARLRSSRSTLKAAYQCQHPQCKQWHLTSQEPHKEKAS